MAYIVLHIQQNVFQPLVDQKNNIELYRPYQKKFPVSGRQDRTRSVSRFKNFFWTLAMANTSHHA